MKIRLGIGRPLLLTLVVCLAVSFLFAQTEVGEKQDNPPPPRTESFAKSDSLVVPWRNLDETCNTSTPNPKPGCNVISGAVWRASHFLTIYNADGSIWHQFSVEPKNEAYFLTAKEQFLKPLGPIGFPIRGGGYSYPDMVVLRMACESPSWYEVEVNENTRETKYILKSDKLWAKTDWYGIFNMSYNVVVDQTKVKLLDGPNGKVIERCADLTFDRMNFGKMEGDWMYVNAGHTLNHTGCSGWIRWRDGRDILVGSVLNGMKIPEPKKLADNP